MSKKPALAILIGEALAKKGKSKSMEEPMEDDMSGEEESMQQIAEEMISAIKANDPKALAELLMESHECMGSKENY